MYIRRTSISISIHHSFCLFFLLFLFFQLFLLCTALPPLASHTQHFSPDILKYWSGFSPKCAARDRVLPYNPSLWREFFFSVYMPSPLSSLSLSVYRSKIITQSSPACYSFSYSSGWKRRGREMKKGGKVTVKMVYSTWNSTPLIVKQKSSRKSEVKA